MEKCKFLKIGNHKACENQSTKNSDFCARHNYVMKTSKAKPCQKCGLGTFAKYQVCTGCGAANVRTLKRYYGIKDYNAEACRMRQIVIS